MIDIINFAGFLGGGSNCKFQNWIEQNERLSTAKLQTASPRVPFSFLPNVERLKLTDRRLHIGLEAVKWSNWVHQNVFQLCKQSKHSNRFELHSKSRTFWIDWQIFVIDWITLFQFDFFLLCFFLLRLLLFFPLMHQPQYQQWLQQQQLLRRKGRRRIACNLRDTWLLCQISRLATERNTHTCVYVCVCAHLVRRMAD